MCLDNDILLTDALVHILWFFSFGTIFMLCLIHMSITIGVLKVTIKELQDTREMVG